MRTTLRRRIGVVLLSLASATGGLVATTPLAQAAAPLEQTPAAFDTGAAAASLGRLLPGQASQITLVAASRATPGVDSYTVSGRTGAITVRGTSPATLLAGVGWYLRNVAHADIGLPGDSTAKLPATLPAVTAAFTNSAVVPHRYALNDTDNGYSGAYRSFADYQHEIDVLALHGFNEVFVTVGAEKPYFDALQQFGYSASDLQSWIPAPAHQPWWLLQNLSGFGGPVSTQLITARATIGKQVCDQLRSLGMTPVLPGYYGTVPTDFATRNPGANVVAQGGWSGFTRDSWLDPTGPVFPKVAAAFYAAQHAAFGDSTMYKMDPLHEGGTAGNVNVTASATAVQQALLAAHPDATWAILAWSSNPSQAVLAGVDKTKMLVLDSQSDAGTGLNRENNWGGTPYAFGTITGFGGRDSMGGSTAYWATEFQQWRTKPGSALKGIAYLPEATGTNPADLAFFGDLGWSADPIDQSAWYAAYATARYGGSDPNAAAAWNLLRQGPYSMPVVGTVQGAPQDDLFTARPSLTVLAGSGTPSWMRYDPATVREALNALLKVDPALRSGDAYRYDLVDTARQALANRSRDLLPLIGDAYRAGDLTTFRALAAEWNKDEADLDKLTGTDARFMVGPWIAQAVSFGATPAERDQLQYDARSLLTTWGGQNVSEANGLHDYATRDWSGLVADVHAKAWSAYLKSLDTALATNSAPVPVDFFAIEDAWAKSTNTYPTTPTGDAYAVASAIAASLPASAPTGAVTGIGGKCADVAGGNSADGTALQLWTCNQTAAQTWQLVGDGTLRARGKCMNVRNGATTAGTAVELSSCNGTTAQKWVQQANNTLKNTKSNLCLDASGGGSANTTPLIVWTCTANPNQLWTLPTPPVGTVTGIGGKCAELTGGSSADGTPLQLRTCDGAAGQTWTVVGDGTLRTDGKCVDVQGSGTAPGTRVQLAACNGSTSQDWTYRSDRTVKNTNAGLCLDASGGGSADGTPLIVWTCTANPNQRWTLPQ
ncbi:alpha-N-acetylglucosaminidase C-terminal domain-containing protein [Kitasatospora sp. NA04385]|uniref:alpha-N-acetylglucosaminidase n=1 Tax=Kitasatospora sp. NA04385 TaxID=2742135 RepID=UPI0015923C0B|nr:alpha-N-acetylglucosaminidase [Kitasatospora sp. NA04385]QKW18010.1 alpha-N-acetylglucosaminidase C-terminal domain-containing protein [Kitasatospora sp. NA04385]